MEEAKLFIVATPLGHRDDVTLRALSTLKETEILFAEDTRELRKLLSLHGIPASGKAIHSYAQHNLDEATERAVAFLKEGRSVALVTDRGTPAVSDPGARLVRSAREENIPVVPIPGASSLTTVLSVSGWEGGAVAFTGFLPRGVSERRELLERIGKAVAAIVIFESPRRARETVRQLEEWFPDGKLFVAREMTKAFEELRWCRLADRPSESLEERGEYCFLLEPSVREAAKPSGETLAQAVALRLSSDKEWSKQIAASLGVSAKSAYDAIQQTKRERASDP